MYNTYSNYYVALFFTLPTMAETYMYINMCMHMHVHTSKNSQIENKTV